MNRAASHFSFSGLRLTRAREEKGLDKQTLADKAGVPASVISKLEAGTQRDARGGAIVRIARALGVDVEHFYLSFETEKQTQHHEEENETGESRS